MNGGDGDPGPGPLGAVYYAEGRAAAYLLGVDRWRVVVDGAESPEAADALRAAYRGHYAGPQDGYYGERIVKDFADSVNGRWWFDRPPEALPWIDQ